MDFALNPSWDYSCSDEMFIRSTFKFPEITETEIKSLKIMPYSGITTCLDGITRVNLDDAITITDSEEIDTIIEQSITKNYDFRSLAQKYSLSFETEVEYYILAEFDNCVVYEFVGFVVA